MFCVFQYQGTKRLYQWAGLSPTSRKGLWGRYMYMQQAAKGLSSEKPSLAAQRSANLWPCCRDWRLLRNHRGRPVCSWPRTSFRHIPFSLPACAASAWKHTHAPSDRESRLQMRDFLLSMSGMTTNILGQGHSDTELAVPVCLPKDTSRGQHSLKGMPVDPGHPLGVTGLNMA